MSQADEILMSLAANVHEHAISDEDAIFVVDQFSREITTSNEQKIVLIQGDHKSERLTFKIPRYIEGHDMALCNLVQVAYINIESEGRDPKYKTGVRLVDNFRINPDNTTMSCSWLITNNATSIEGILSFMLIFSCMNGKLVEYRWNTNSFNEIYVLKSIDSNLVFDTEYIDVIEQWKETVLTELETYIKQQIESNVDVVQIQTNKTNIESLRKTVDGNHTNVTNEIAVQKARLDAMAKVPDGGATGDLEIADLSVDFEGNEYENGGDAFRSVSEKLFMGYKSKKSVNPDHTTFITRGSNNLFSKRTCFVDTWINSSGFISMKNHFASDFIPCSYGETYSCTRPSSFAEVHYFDENKNKLSNSTITSGQSSFTIKNKAARYFILQSDNAIIDRLMINRGSTLLPYEEWDGLYKLAIDLKDLKQIFDSSKYFHVATNLFVRDTIRENTWFNQTNGFIKLNNYFCTDFINIEVGSYIFSTKKLPTTPGAVEIHIFDENHNRLKTVELKSISGPGYANYILDVEYDDYKYMILQMNMAYKDVGFIINKGTELLEYDDGKEYLLPEYFDLSSVTELISTKLGLNDYEIILPEHIYLRNNGTTEQFNLYFDNIFYGKKPPVIDIVCNYGKHLEECWRYETNSSGYPQANEEFDLTIKGLDHNLNVLVSKTIKITVIKTKSLDEINYIAIGDSITNQGYYVDYLTKKVSNLTSLGTMGAINEDFYREGRSGWSLVHYLSNIGKDAYSNEFNIDSPFVYPVGLDPKSYKGNVSQMRAIVSGKGTYILPFLRKVHMKNGSYLYGSDGYFSNPKIGDYMCDPSLDTPWVVWDGYMWAPLADQPTEFEFSFSKYMERYSEYFNDKSPTHVSICLGANDFQQNTPSDITIESWYTNLLTVINSIKAYDSNIVIMICIPPVGADQDAWGKQLNSGATSYNYYRNIKLLEKVLISKHNDNDNIYVIPMVEMIDTEYAYDRTVEKRNTYTEETVSRQNNWVHPNAGVGHNQMSDALLGVFEKTR